jgi:hypothetical protein
VASNTRIIISDAERAAEIAAEQQAADLIDVPMAVAVPAHARLAGRLSLWKDPRPLPTLLIDAKDWAEAYMHGTKAHPNLCPAVLRWTQCRIWHVKGIVGGVIDPDLRKRLRAAEQRRYATAREARLANAVAAELAKMAKAVWIEEGLSRFDAPQPHPGAAGQRRPLRCQHRIHCPDQGQRWPAVQAHRS